MADYTLDDRPTRLVSTLGTFAELSDPTGQYEAVLFSEALVQYRDVLEPGRMETHRRVEGGG